MEAFLLPPVYRWHHCCLNCCSKTTTSLDGVCWLLTSIIQVGRGCSDPVRAWVPCRALDLGRSGKKEFWASQMPRKSTLEGGCRGSWGIWPVLWPQHTRKCEKWWRLVVWLWDMFAFFFHFSVFYLLSFFSIFYNEHVIVTKQKAKANRALFRRKGLWRKETEWTPMEEEFPSPTWRDGPSGYRLQPDGHRDKEVLTIWRPVPRAT